VRSTWMSTGYSLAVAVFGGFAPFIATWLIAATGSPLSPIYYLIAAAIVYVGDQIGVGSQLATGVVVVLGIRIFTNAAAIRRALFHA